VSWGIHLLFVADVEAEEVQSAILEDRVHIMKPTVFVRVQQIALQNVFGWWRQFYCPLFEINKMMIHNMCIKVHDILQFTFEARFCFAGLLDFKADTIHAAVTKDAQIVAQEKEECVIVGIEQWASNVRVWALQDLARDLSGEFTQC